MKNNPTRFVALLNRLWDGKPTTAHRKTTQSYSILNRRLTLNLMMQPLLMSQLHQGASGVNRQSGFMARCLLSHPTSSMGQRFYKEPPSTGGYLDEYNARIEGCLKQSEYLTQDGCINLPTLQMSKAAKKIWVQYFNQIEAGLSKRTEWHGLTDFASKSAENVARLAALFHLFEGKQGDIECAHIEQSIEINLWHLKETKRILGMGEDVEAISHAEKLIDWMINREEEMISQRDLQRLGPLRNKNQLEDIICLLEDHNYLKSSTQGKKTLIEINPKLT